MTKVATVVLGSALLSLTAGVAVSQTEATARPNTVIILSASFAAASGAGVEHVSTFRAAVAACQLKDSCRVEASNAWFSANDAAHHYVDPASGSPKVLAVRWTCSLTAGETAQSIPEGQAKTLHCPI